MKSSPPSNLEASAKKRTQGVIARVTAAMGAIELEIDANDGVYPFNKGRVTQAEVCRRASVDKVTLQKPTHKDTTRKAVTEWLAGLTANLVKGRRSIRRSVTERAAIAEGSAKQIATHYHIARIELQDARRAIRDLQRELQEAKAANEP